MKLVVIFAGIITFIATSLPLAEKIGYLTIFNKLSERQELVLGTWKGVYSQESVKPVNQIVNFSRDGRKVSVFFTIDIVYYGKKVKESLRGDVKFLDESRFTLTLNDTNKGSEYVAIVLCKLSSVGNEVSCKGIGSGAEHAEEKLLIASIENLKKI